MVSSCSRIVTGTKVLSSSCAVVSSVASVVALGSEVVLCFARWNFVGDMCFLCSSDAKVVKLSSFGLSVWVWKGWRPSVALDAIISLSLLGSSGFTISVVEASSAWVVLQGCNRGRSVAGTSTFGLSTVLFDGSGKS